MENGRDRARDEPPGGAVPRGWDKASLAGMVGAAADWVWETDARHCYTHVSEGCQAATGIKRSSIIGRSRLDTLDREASSPEAAAAHRADLAAHRPFGDFLVTLGAARAECRHVLLSGVPRFDRKGRFAGYRGLARNVTPLLRQVHREPERRAVENDPAGTNLEETNAERLMAALNVMEDAFVYYDRDDRIVLYNEALVTMYAGLEDVIRTGLHVSEFVDAGLDRGLWSTGEYSPAEWRDAYLAGRGEAGHGPTMLQFADGRWVLHRELRTDDGGRMGICTDVTELKRREEAAEGARAEAEAAKARLQAAIDALRDGFVLWDADDRLVACNDAFRGQFAFLPNLAVGRTFEEMLYEFAQTGVVKDAVGREEEWAREHAASRVRELGQEIVFETHDGRWMMRRDQITGTGDRVGIRTDITDLKKRETELAAATERSGELLSDLERTIDTMRMGVVLLDSDLKAEIVNRAFYDIWRLERGDVGVGCSFRDLMDINRHNGIYDVADADWEDYVAHRLAEIRDGNIPPREFQRRDGSTLIYSVTSLSGGKRLVCYYDVTQIKEREAELAEALERAHLADAVINGVKDPVFVKDAELRFVFVNEAFADLFGTNPGAMLGRRASDYVDPEEAADFEASESVVLKTGNDYRVEEDFEFEGIGWSRVVRKNRLETETGTKYVAGFIFDITDIKRREREAEEARELLAKVLETLPAGVIIYDKNDRLVLSNRIIKENLPALAAFSEPGQELRTAIEAAHDAGYFRVSGDDALDALYDTDREAWVEGTLRRYYMPRGVSERRNPDGRWYQVYDTRTDDGLFVGVRVDITELKEREAALRETTRENELFRSLIDNVPVAIYAKKPDLKLVYVNQGWCDLTGLDKVDAIGRTDAEVFGHEGVAYMDADRAVLESGEMKEIEETATSSDGTPCHRIARKSTMIASDGTLYLIGTTTDVSELKRREEELRAAEQRAVLADRAKSEFLANMSHEIRTPMNGVLGMAELLAKSELDQKQRTFTDIIVKSGNALLTIINDILDFSKIDAGQLVLDPAPLNLAESVEDVATLMSTRAKEKDLELIVRVAPGLPRMVVGDVGRLRQIVTNLVGNAVKFTDSGHVLVDVSGKERDGHATLTFKVTDTGIGIPDDKLALVFEKFSQVDSSSTRRHEGTGLGLAITSRLVELMGGKIGAVSSLGRGSTFWFTVSLPVAEESGRRKQMPIDVSGARVLVVDDNEVNRSILIEQMNSWGFDACAARNGPEALAVLKETARLGMRVDCVVLDYQMPGMTGAEVAAAIRANPLIAATPIVMLTSVDQTMNNAQFAKLDISAQLIKPARSSALLEVLVGEMQKGRAASHEGEDVVDAAPVSKPVPSEPQPVVAAPPSADRPQRVSARRLDILVAEDNEVNQLVFAQILGETPYTFEIVRNGALAVAAHTEMEPGMILMDVSMPEMNGLEATQAIRAAEAEWGEYRVPIVGVTAHALKGDRERCLSAGMDDYLPKPISPNALLDKVRKWLEEDAELRSNAG